MVVDGPECPRCGQRFGHGDRVIQQNRGIFVEQPTNEADMAAARAFHFEGIGTKRPILISTTVLDFQADKDGYSFVHESCNDGVFKVV